MTVSVSNLSRLVNGIPVTPGREVLGIKMKWLKTLGGASSNIGNESFECLSHVLCRVCSLKLWGIEASWVSEMKSIKDAEIAKASASSCIQSHFDEINSLNASIFCACIC